MKNKGFTLIEVIICFFILCIVIALFTSVIGVFINASNDKQIEIREQHKPDQQVQEAPIEKPKGEEKRL